MALPLRFEWIEEFIAERFPDPEPELFCVRAYWAVDCLLFSAALLGTTEPTRLQRFTGYHPGFIAAVAWNMQGNRLWTGAVSARAVNYNDILHRMWLWES